MYMSGRNETRSIKLAYIGGGSKAWARVFMNDLALTAGLTGEIALYDIDRAAAERNRRIGERINEHPDARAKWRYTVADTLETALTGADFVAISILPGTFDDMAADVHLPEKYGVYQSVGDTVGPGGVMRALRTVPLFEGFARAIRDHCPRAWVINLTNPMTILCKTLFDVFPGIKAFGCCHEVFHAEDFLCCVVKEQLGVPRPDRHELTVEASGINHFTWTTEARWQDVDVMALLATFIERFYESGYCEQGDDPQAFRGENPFLYGNKVKMDLFRRFGALGAAGDRHLVEFMDGRWYLADKSAPDRWLYHLTPVDYRRADQKRKIEEAEALAAGRKPVTLKRSDEELIRFMEAILGMGPVVSNANVVNVGQMSELPLGSVVETFCAFDQDSVTPLPAKPLPVGAAALVLRNAENIEALYAAIRNRDLDAAFHVFMGQPLCSRLTREQGCALFREMAAATAGCLAPWYDLGAWINRA